MPSPFETLIPPQEWVDTPAVTYYDVYCPTCFALVRDRNNHREYHIKLLTETTALIEEAVSGAT